MSATPGIDWLFNLQRFGSKPGLERMFAFAERLGDPRTGMDFVLVGGTNGKGSTSRTLANILTAAGRRTGHFTSPHMTRVMERYVVDGAELPLAWLEQELTALRPLAEEIGATFFEVQVAVAWLLFVRAGCDFAVMEVGMGGLYDATNACDPLLSVITNVALDHTEVLGDTVEKIAFEKAGIMRPGRPARTGATGGALAVITAEAAAIGAELETMPAYELELLGLRGVRVTLTGAGGMPLTVETPLVGPHQAGNVALAVAAAQRLGLPEDAIRAGVAGTTWPGRLEPVAVRDRTWLLDGAHNPDGAAALARALVALGIRPAALVLGMAADKDAGGVLDELGRLAPLAIATAASLSPRALAPHDLGQLLEDRGFAVLPAADPAAALALAVNRTAPGDVIVVAGSLYLLGEIRPLLLGEELEEWERWQ